MLFSVGSLLPAVNRSYDGSTDFICDVHNSNTLRVLYVGETYDLSRQHPVVPNAHKHIVHASCCMTYLTCVEGGRPGENPQQSLALALV